jgi:pimeloyl-ACP methyl ester carboxylesterase
LSILVAVAASVAFTLIVAGLVYQSIGLARSARRFPPPGRLIDVDGHRLHAVCLGEGQPTVVLESAIAASSLSWSRVQPEVARFARVCAYDRAGLAWSDAAPGPRTIANILDDLHHLLVNIGAPAPYVMVGHSFGAFVCLAYAARHPELVRGLVLVDPPSEWVHMDRQHEHLLWGGFHMSRLGAQLARVGVVRLCLALLTGGAPGAPRNFVKLFGPTTARTLERLVGEVRKLPPDLHPVVQAHWCQPKCFMAMANYLRALEAAAAEAMKPGGPPVPRVVISSGDQPPEIIEAHQQLAHMSPHGQHVIAKHSTHWIPFDEPALIVDAIRHVIEAAARACPVD